jgi:hypothetical protein
MKIFDLQQIGLAGCEPLARRGTLTLGAMSIPTTTVGNLGKPAVATAMNMPTQSSRSARLDRCHNAKLATIEMAGIGLAVGFAVVAEDIRHLELRARHLSRVSSTVFCRPETVSPAP